MNKTIARHMKKGNTIEFVLTKIQLELHFSRDCVRIMVDRPIIL